MARTTVDSGTYTSLEICAAVHGRVAVAGAWGTSTLAAGAPGESPTALYSAGKPYVAVAIAQQWERKQLDVTDHVRRFIPEYAQNGKQDVRIYHLLSHTVAAVGESRQLEQLAASGTAANRPRPSPAALLRSAVSAPLAEGAVPGTIPRYSRTWSWLVLAEILRRVDGRHWSDYVRDEICEPLELHGTGIAHGESPATGMRAPLREVLRFLDALCPRPGDDRLLRPRTASAVTRPWRSGMLGDPPVVDVGLGVILESSQYGRRYTFFGPTCSPITFGHMGYYNGLIFHDPVHDLSVAFMGVGTPSKAAAWLAFHRLSKSLYETLGLRCS